MSWWNLVAYVYPIGLYYKLNILRSIEGFISHLLLGWHYQPVFEEIPRL